MVSGCVEKIIGSKERGELIVGLNVFQGEKISNMKGVIGSGGVSSQMKEADPLIMTWCFKKPKFCLFSNRMPDLEVRKGESNPRDVILEKTKQIVQSSGRKETGANHGVRKVILSTTLGDVYIKLFPEFAPKTVENFVTHAKNGYYDNCVFHRVVKGYVQTGDPLNDGTGGESIWGCNFEDEICEELKHDRPFTLSMANSGPNTNGSQFFITTIPSPWLDKRHTIFGRVYKGTEVITEIEYLKTDNFDKPLMDVRIFRIQPIN
jgi:peptidylprolyl isomerase domain and WD repeat-containing protein 1